MHKITVLPQGLQVMANSGDNLQQVLFELGIAPDAPCAGAGKCGKCKVTVNGVSRKACQTEIWEDMVIQLPSSGDTWILEAGECSSLPWNPLICGYCAAFDLGTTSLCCYLLDKKDGREIASRAMANPQRSAGADVVSRIRAASMGQMERLTKMLRDAMTSLLLQCCRDAGVSPEDIRLISAVGNPAMQQFFLGMPLNNLVQLPFHPVLTRAEFKKENDCLPDFPNAVIMVIPDISAYVGADTVGCIISSGMAEITQTLLLVDIGTNGEMVLSHNGRLLSCATAAGPALEGADISCGVIASPGAIDRVWAEDGALHCHVIGGGKALGICGSGIVDAVATALDLGLMNARGKLAVPALELAEGITLSQEDIRALQLAKGAIRAGIELLCKRMEIAPADIDTVLLAGAFGNYLDQRSACRIGLLPPELEGKIRSIGNAAGAGAKQLCRNRDAYHSLDTLVKKVESVELGAQKDFSKAFARGMRFPSLEEMEENR